MRTSHRCETKGAGGFVLPGINGIRWEASQALFLGGARAKEERRRKEEERRSAGGTATQVQGQEPPGAARQVGGPGGMAGSSGELGFSSHSPGNPEERGHICALEENIETDMENISDVVSKCRKK